ncbi:MAG: 30S ribosome-binding factor RbfA [Deltaproteobacteria bacterium]|nr:30S ribosome-binding factor RbfA [Deltaproteobacteria bacterium]
MKRLPFDRAERIGQAIYEVVAQLCRERLADPRLAAMQITGAKVTKDLRLARVYYFLRGDLAARAACAEALACAHGLLKRAVAQRLAMKFTPELEFLFDESIERGERIDALLGSLKQD